MFRMKNKNFCKPTSNAYSIVNFIKDSQFLIVNVYINFTLNHVFENVKTLYIIDTNFTFLLKHFNRTFFPNVTRIYWLNKSIFQIIWLYNFNLTQENKYDRNLCEIFIDINYTSDYKTILNLTQTYHIILLDNLKEHLINNCGKYDYFIKNNHNINLDFYRKELFKWMEDKKLK